MKTNNNVIAVLMTCIIFTLKLRTICNCKNCEISNQSTDMQYN